MSNRLSLSKRASEVRKSGVQDLGDKSQCLDAGGDDTVERAGDGSGGELVEQARSVLGREVGGESAVLDGAEVDGVEASVGGVATEEHGVGEVHGEDLVGHVVVGVRCLADDPVLLKKLVIVRLVKCD